MKKKDYTKFVYTYTDDMEGLTDRKNNDYTGASDDAFANLRMAENMGIVKTEIGILVRMTDKISRINSFIQKGSFKVKDETIRDTCMDLSVYSMLLAAYFKSKKETVLKVQGIHDAFNDHIHVGGDGPPDVVPPNLTDIKRKEGAPLEFEVVAPEDDPLATHSTHANTRVEIDKDTSPDGDNWNKGDKDKIEPIKIGYLSRAAWHVEKDKIGVDSIYSCHFCETEDYDPKTGLICGVCMECAMRHEYDHGVFTKCLEGTFNLEELKKVETKKNKEINFPNDTGPKKKRKKFKYHKNIDDCNHDTFNDCVDCEGIGVDDEDVKKRVLKRPNRKSVYHDDPNDCNHGFDDCIECADER